MKVVVYSEGILSLDGGQVVSFTSRHLSLALSGPQSRRGRFDEDKILQTWQESNHSFSNNNFMLYFLCKT
jgi:hypothetical protein